MNSEAKSVSRTASAHMHTGHPTRPGGAGGDGSGALFALLLSGAAGVPDPGAPDGSAPDALAAVEAEPGDQTQALLAQMSAAVGGWVVPVAPPAQDNAAVATDATTPANTPAIGAALAGVAVSGAAVPNAANATAEPPAHVAAGRRADIPAARGPVSGKAEILSDQSAAAAPMVSDSVLASAAVQMPPQPQGRLAHAGTALGHGGMGRGAGASHGVAEQPASDTARGDGLQRVWQAAAQPTKEPQMATGVAQASGLLRPRDDERSSAADDATRWRTVAHGMGVLESALATPAATAAPVPPATATVAAAPADIAQQFQYWLGNDVHNAELHVDGMGPDPVQVQISLTGNEAQVVFRTDQAQTRELLGQALGTLDQMLRSQGLALSGGWVGGSGGQSQSFASQGGSGGQPRATHGAGRAGAITGKVGVASGSMQAVSAQGIDCFV